MGQRAETEYAYLIPFAREQAALLERIRRTGSRPPMQPEWRGAEVYLQELRAAVDAAEREQAVHPTRPRGLRRSILGRLFSKIPSSAGRRPSAG